MTQEGHLQVFDLILETRSPVFIGNGKSYTKKEYLYDSQRQMVSFVDEMKFFTYLAEHGLADAYEGFILENMSENLLDFLQNTCELPQATIDSFVRCKISAGDALDQNITLKEIQQFIRDGNNRAYVPGSSIKGALRTVLLKAMLLEKPPVNPDPRLPFQKYDTMEAEYFHTLSIKKDKNGFVQVSNPLNSIMQGVRISDSLPISDAQLCLAPKIDEFSDGTYNKINICRECMKPGTRIRCTITLDQSILEGKITKETIMDAIERTAQHYKETVLSHYPLVPNYMTSRTILLGGGAGFQSKTVVDPYYGDQAVKMTSDVLVKAFRNHFHHEDIAEGISPRALKQTDFNRAAYPFGVCEVYIR